MKQRYIISNNEVIVADNKDGELVFKKYEYQDNIEDILVIENIIEELTNDKDNIINSLNEKKEIIEPKSIKKIQLAIIGFMLTIAAVCAILLSFGTIKLGLALFISMGASTFVSGISLAVLGLSVKEHKKDIKFYENLLPYIIEELEKNKTLLLNLKKKKSANKKENITKAIKHKIKLEEIRNNIKSLVSQKVSESYDEILEKQKTKRKI